MNVNNDDLKAAIPVAIGGAAAAFIWWIAGPAALAFVSIAAIGGYGYVSKVFRQREEVARAATYANAVAPYQVFSTLAEEPAAAAYDRAAHIREQLRLSGNPYAHKLPIIVFPFSAFYGAGNNPFGPQAEAIAYAKYQHDCAVKTSEEFGRWKIDGKRILSDYDYQIFLTGVLPYTPQTVHP